MSFGRRKILLAVCAAAVLLLPALRTTMLPFALALFLSGCLQKPIHALHSRGIPRILSVPAILLLGLLPVLGLIVGGVWYGLRGIQTLAENLLPLLEQMRTEDAWLYRIITALPPSAQDFFQTLEEQLNAQKEALAGQLMQRLILWSGDALAALPGKLGQVGIFLLFVLFCSIGYPELRLLIRRILPPDWQAWLGRVQRDTAARLRLWLRAERKLVALIALELAGGLAALRVTHWPFLAAFIALVDLLPLIGSGLILLPWALIRLLLGERIQALGFGLLWLCVWLSRTLLEPKLVGQQLQLPTAVSFFAAILGLRLWGFKGLILFPILAAVAVSLLPQDRTKPPHSVP